MESHELRQCASVALSVLDLTNLKEDCSSSDIEALCARAKSPFGAVAAICIWPRFVAEARALLGAGSDIKIATVVNFPGGDLPVDVVVAETAKAVDDGADEIDLVIPYSALLAGDEAAVTAMVVAVRAVAKAPVKLKTILETGVLKDPALIRRASQLAIQAGSDFIKTSTGKVAVNATLEAADIMLQVIRDLRANVGFKPAGGISTVGDAALYFRHVRAIMGDDWLMPSTFRFGASSLMNDIEAVLSGQPQAGGAKPESGAEY